MYLSLVYIYIYNVYINKESIEIQPIWQYVDQALNSVNIQRHKCLSYFIPFCNVYKLDGLTCLWPKGMFTYLCRSKIV